MTAAETRPESTTAAAAEQPPPQYDPVALAESFASAADKSAKVIGDFVTRQAASGQSLVSDEFGLTKAFFELAAKMLSNPYRLAETQMNLWWEYSALWQSSMLKLLGHAILARGRAGQERQALPARGLGSAFSVRLHQAVLSDHRPLAAQRGGQCRGTRRAHAQEGRFLHPAIHRRAGAVELRTDQSRGIPRNDRIRRPEPGQVASTICSTTSSAATASSRYR